MALDFPNSPSNGSTYVVGGVTWTYDGTKWVTSTASLAGTIPDAPKDGATYGRLNGSWSAVTGSGGGGGGVASFNTRAGAVVLSATDVTSALTFTPYNATNPSKYQTDTQVAGALSGYLPLAGGTGSTMTGPLYFSGGGFAAFGDTNNKFLQWSPNYYEVFSTTNLTRYSVMGGATVAAFNVSGDYTLYGKLSVYNDPNFGLSQQGTKRIFSWAANWFDYFDTSNGSRSWALASGNYMTLDGTGNLYTPGNVTTTKQLVGGVQELNGTGSAFFDYRNAGGGFFPLYHHEPNNGQFSTEVWLVTGFVAGLQITTSAGIGPINKYLYVKDTSSGASYGMNVDFTSDARIKQDVAPTVVDALAVLDQVEVIQCTVLPQAAAALSTGTPEERAALEAGAGVLIAIGVIAQQVQQVIPEMVNVVPQDASAPPALPSDLHMIAYEKAVPYLIRAVQQLSARVAALEAA